MPNFLYFETEVACFETTVYIIVVRCFVCCKYDEILMVTGKLSDNIRVTECLSPWILNSNKTSAINLHVMH